MITTLKKKKDFEKLYSEGSRFDCGCLLFIWRFNNLDTLRVGCSVSKKIGKACVRNLVKRWIKNSARRMANDAARNSRKVSGVDFIAKARPGIVKHGFGAVEQKAADFFKTFILRRDIVEL